MFPVVLHHGLLGLNVQIGGKRLWRYWAGGIEESIRDAGHALLVSQVHPTGSIATRAEQLRDCINDALGKTAYRLVILAHSMGGLDARHMVSRLGMAGRVAAIVTICTPHRGSSYADWCATHIGERLGVFEVLTGLGVPCDAFTDLTTEHCVRFNEQTPDAPGVRYYSIAGARPWRLVPPFLYHSHKVIAEAEGENDGLVSVTSARWGRHLATWPADHFHAVNRRMAPEIKNRTGNITPRYLDLLAKVQAELRQ